MIIIWLIGFMFTYGMVYYTQKEANKEVESWWGALSTSVMVFMLWPFCLGGIVTGVIIEMGKEKDEPKGEG